MFLEPHIVHFFGSSDKFIGSSINSLIAEPKLASFGNIFEGESIIIDGASDEYFEV